jgi:hypothetical protein
MAKVALFNVGTTAKLFDNGSHTLILLDRHDSQALEGLPQYTMVAKARIDTDVTLASY